MQIFIEHFNGPGCKKAKSSYGGVLCLYFDRRNKRSHFTSKKCHVLSYMGSVSDDWKHFFVELYGRNTRHTKFIFPQVVALIRNPSRNYSRGLNVSELDISNNKYRVV